MPCYLNNAAEGWPKAPGTARAVKKFLEAPCREAGRDTGAAALPLACRQRVAKLLGVSDSTRVVFTLNATLALNLAILGLGLGAGSLVVTSVAGHNTVLRPLERLRRESGVRVWTVGRDARGGLDEDAYDAALRQEPKLVALNHVSNVTGRVLDVQRFFARARAAGARTLLDASQSVGHMEFGAEQVGADMAAFGGHKGLHGPTGVGILYVKPGLDLRQTLVGGTGVRSAPPAHPPEMPLRLEAGTPNLTGLAGLEAALAWMEVNGARRRRVEAERAAELQKGLGATPGVDLFGADGIRTGILSFRLAGWRVTDLGHCLQESFGVICRSGLHCAPLLHEAIGTAPEGTVRFSVSGFTTEREVSMAVEAVRRISKCTS